jgi:hypothetical protein
MPLADCPKPIPSVFELMMQDDPTTSVFDLMMQSHAVFDSMMQEDLHLAPSPTTPPTTQPTPKSQSNFMKSQRRQHKRKLRKLLQHGGRKQLSRPLPTQTQPYRTQLLVNLPSIQPYKGKSHIKWCLSWLLRHLRHSDPTVLLEPWLTDPQVLKCCKQGRGHPKYGLSPPLGPEFPLEKLQDIGGKNNRPYFRAFLDTEDGSTLPCTIVIRHSIRPILLLDRLNVPKYHQQPYSFEPIPRGVLARHLASTRAWLQANLLDKPHSAKARAVEHIRKTSGDPLPLSHLGAGYRSPPPITCHEVLLPLAVELTPHAQSLSRHHSATTKTTLGIRWLLAVLERQRTTSWDLVSLRRLWWVF